MHASASTSVRPCSGQGTTPRHFTVPSTTHFTALFTVHPRSSPPRHRSRFTLRRVFHSPLILNHRRTSGTTAINRMGTILTSKNVQKDGKKSSPDLIHHRPHREYLIAMPTLLKLSPLLSLILLTACVTAPTGPSVLVLPGTNKNFDQFRADDLLCKQYAIGQNGNTTPGQVSAESGVKSAAVGTAIGAVAGAAIGGGRGAGTGAGVGLMIGGLEGSGASQKSARTSQQRYDNAYIQCMYSYGHRVPVSGRMSDEQPRPSRSLPPPPPPPPPSSTR